MKQKHKQVGDFFECYLRLPFPFDLMSSQLIEIQDAADDEDRTKNIGVGFGDGSASNEREAQEERANSLALDGLQTRMSSRRERYNRLRFRCIISVAEEGVEERDHVKKMQGVRELFNRRGCAS